MLEFDAPNHIYRYDGRVVPSVTQILGEWILVNGFYVNTYKTKVVIAESAMKDAADHGTAVHQGVNILLTDHLNWNELHPSLRNPLKEFGRWHIEHGPELVSIGYKMYSKRYGYAGTPDPFYVLKIGRRYVLCFVEIKSGAHLLAGPQIAAYIQMYREHSKFKGDVQRWVLELPKEGAYKFERCGNRLDWAFFESCLLRRSYIERLA